MLVAYVYLIATKTTRFIFVIVDIEHNGDNERSINVCKTRLNKWLISERQQLSKW